MFQKRPKFEMKAISLAHWLSRNKMKNTLDAPVKISTDKNSSSYVWTEKLARWPLLADLFELFLCLI